MQLTGCGEKGPWKMSWAKTKEARRRAVWGTVSPSLAPAILRTQRQRVLEIQQWPGKGKGEERTNHRGGGREK